MKKLIAELKKFNISKEEIRRIREWAKEVRKGKNDMYTEFICDCTYSVDVTIKNNKIISCEIELLEMQAREICFEA